MFTRAAGVSAVFAVLMAGVLTTVAVGCSQSDGGSSAVAGPKAGETGNAKGADAQGKTGEQKPGAQTSRGVKPSDTVPALKPAQLKYQHQSWGDPKTELGMVILAPQGWKMVKLSTFEVKFTSPNGRWNLRVNGLPKDRPIKTGSDDKYALTSSSTEDFRLVSRETGTTRATNPSFAGMVFHHRTLTYTYTDPTRGRRLVVDRFVSLDDTSHTLFEVNAGGRPQDAAALAAITAKATEDFIRLP